MTFFPLAARGKRQQGRLTVQMGDSNEYGAQPHPDELQLDVSGPSGAGLLLTCCRIPGPEGERELNPEKQLNCSRAG